MLRCATLLLAQEKDRAVCSVFHNVEKLQGCDGQCATKPGKCFPSPELPSLKADDVYVEHLWLQLHPVGAEHGVCSMSEDSEGMPSPLALLAVAP